MASWECLEDHPRTCKWLVTPIYKPFRPFGRGITLLRGLTNHGYYPLTNWDDPPSGDTGQPKVNQPKPSLLAQLLASKGWHTPQRSPATASRLANQIPGVQSPVSQEIFCQKPGFLRGYMINTTVDGRNPELVEVGSLSHYLHGF